MKRRILILALVLVFACSAALLVACKDTSLDKAKAALEEQYANYTKLTSGEAYELAGSIDVEGKTYTITWTSNADSTKVAIAEKAGGGYMVTVTKGDAKLDYTLTATIANAKGETVTATFSCSIPANTQQPDNPNPSKTDLTPVATALTAQYATNSFSAGTNFTVVDKITVANVEYALTWKVTGAGASQVTVSGTSVTVTKGSAQVAYKLVATITDPKDATNTKEVSFDATIPANSVTPPTGENNGSAEKPYTAAEAVAIIKGWESGKTVSDSPVYVKGTVKADSTESASKAGTYIFDLTGTDGDLVIYYARSTAKLVAGDEVVVYGHLILFANQESTKYEMSVAKNVALGVVSINGTATTFVPGTKDVEETPDDQKGGKNNPYTVAELRALTATTVPEGLVYAQGYVKSISAHSTSGYNINLVDTKDGTDTFYIFRGNLASSAIPCVGDKVQAYGYLVAYNSGYQFGFKNSTSTEVSILERGDATIKSAASNQHVTITFTPAADSATGIVSGKNGANVSFTVECDEGWELNGEPADAVSVSGGEVVYNSGMYLVKLAGDMEVTVTVKVAGSQTIDYGTEEHPYSVAQAIANAPASGKSEAVWVTGIVVSGSNAEVPTAGSSGQVKFYIADTANGTGMQVRYADLASGIEAIYIGDTVVVKGYLSTYNGEKQIDKKDDSNAPLVATMVSRGVATLKVSTESSANATVIITGATEGVLTGHNHDQATFTVTVADGYELTNVTVAGQVVEGTAGQYTVKYGGNAEIVVTTHAEGTTIPGTAEQPYTVEEAITVATALPSNGYSASPVYVTGYIISATENTSYHNWQIYIADEVGGKTTFLCYRVELSTGIDTIAANDKVVIYGYLQNYNGKTPEITNKDTTNPSLTVRVVGDATIKAATTNAHSTITFTPAADGTTGIVSGKNGDTVTFTISVETGYELVDVLVAGNTISANNNVYSVVLTGDMAVVVNVKEVGAADPVVLYTVATTSAKAAKNTNNYTSSTTVTDNGLTLNVTNFNTGSTWDHIRCGNSKAAGNASIATSEAIKGTVTSIVINISAVTGINELYLEISDDSTFATSTKVPCANPVAGNNQFTITEPAANKYYRIVFDMSKTSSNGVVHLTQVVFNGYPAE